MVEGAAISAPGSRMEKRMKKGMPQPSSKEGAQTPPFRTESYLVLQLLHQVARDTGNCSLYSKWAMGPTKNVIL